MAKLGSRIWGPPDDETAREFAQYSADYPSDKCRADYLHVVSHARRQIEKGHEGAAIAAYIRHLIANQIPASLIRLGDGEGNILFPKLGKYPRLNEYCLGRISRICFGHERVVLDDAELFTRQLDDAIETADLIGGPGWDSIAGRFSVTEESIDVRATCGMRVIYNTLAETGGYNNAMWASAWFSRSLLPHYQGLLQGVRSLGVISCYPELAEKLQRISGAREVRSYLLPTQASIARTIGTPNGHFPDVYLRTLDQLEKLSEPTVFIVAGGILAKAYCSAIKRRGGIAIDVGSVADVWMNVKSRPGITPEFVDKWRLG